MRCSAAAACVVTHRVNFHFSGPIRGSFTLFYIIIAVVLRIDRTLYRPDPNMKPTGKCVVEYNKKISRHHQTPELPWGAPTLVIKRLTIQIVGGSCVSSKTTPCSISSNVSSTISTIKPIKTCSSSIMIGDLT